MLEAQLYSCVGLRGMQLVTQTSLSAARTYQGFYLGICHEGPELIPGPLLTFPSRVLCVSTRVCKQNHKWRCNSVCVARFEHVNSTTQGEKQELFATEHS